jgi:hypothetical protein
MVTMSWKLPLMANAIGVFEHCIDAVVRLVCCQEMGSTAGGRGSLVAECVDDLN